MNKSDIKRVTAEITLMRMALNKTDSSLEGLEARLADLELKVANGVTVSQALPQDVSATQKPEIKSAPKKEPEKKPSDSSFSTPIQEIGNKTLSEWVDILDDYSAKNPSCSPFLENSSAVLDMENKKIVIHVANAFFKMMLDNAQATVALVQIAAKYGIMAQSAEVVVAPKPPMAKDPMQDLI